MTRLSEVREDVEKCQSEWFQEATSFAHAVAVQPAIPRRCSRQQHRNNVEGDTPEAYYRRAVTVPLLDHLIQEMEWRNKELQQTAAEGLCLIPSALLSLSKEDRERGISNMLEKYEGDLPDLQSVSKEEIFQWLTFWQQREK